MTRKINRGPLLGWLTFFALVYSSICNGQMIESQKSVDEVKKDVIDFLISQNDLEKGMTAKEYDKRMVILELLEEKVLGYSKTGIFRIKVYTSHTKQYLLIKDNSKHQILDTDNLGGTIQAVVSFLVDEKLPNDKIASYTTEVIEMYKINENRNPAQLKTKNKSN